MSAAKIALLQDRELIRNLVVGLPAHVIKAFATGDLSVFEFKEGKMSYEKGIYIFKNRQGLRAMEDEIGRFVPGFRADGAVELSDGTMIFYLGMTLAGFEIRRRQHVYAAGKGMPKWSYLGQDPFEPMWAKVVTFETAKIFKLGIEPARTCVLLIETIGILCLGLVRRRAFLEAAKQAGMAHLLGPLSDPGKFLGTNAVFGPESFGTRDWKVVGRKGKALERGEFVREVVGRAVRRTIREHARKVPEAFEPIGVLLQRTSGKLTLELPVSGFANADHIILADELTTLLADLKRVCGTGKGTPYYRIQEEIKQLQSQGSIMSVARAEAVKSIGLRGRLMIQALPTPEAYVDPVKDQIMDLTEKDGVWDGHKELLLRTVFEVFLPGTEWRIRLRRGKMDNRGGPRDRERNELDFVKVLVRAFDYLPPKAYEHIEEEDDDDFLL